MECLTETFAKRQMFIEAYPKILERVLVRKTCSQKRNVRFGFMRSRRGGIFRTELELRMFGLVLQSDECLFEGVPIVEIFALFYVN